MFNYLYSILPTWPTSWTWTPAASPPGENFATCLEDIPQNELCNVTKIEFVASTILSPRGDAEDGELTSEALASELTGSLIISQIDSEANSSKVVVEAKFLSQQSQSLLQGIHKEKAQLPTCDSGGLQPSLTASFLEEFEKVIQAPTVIFGAKGNSFWEEMALTKVPESTDAGQGDIEDGLVVRNIIPNKEVTETFSTPGTVGSVPPPPPGEAPRLNIATSRKISQRTVMDQVVEVAQRKNAAFDPKVWAMEQDIYKLQRTIKNLMINHQENPIFLIKYPDLISSFLKGIETSSSMEDLTESRQFNDETSDKIVAFHQQFCSNSAVKTKLHALLKESLQELQALAVNQKKKNEEAIKAFATSHAFGRAAQQRAMADDEGDFATRKERWLSKLPHKLFKQGLSQMKKVRLLSALSTPAVYPLTKQYAIKVVEDLDRPIRDYIVFRKQVKHCVDEEQLNALKKDFNFWTELFVNHLPNDFKNIRVRS